MSAVRRLAAGTLAASVAFLVVSAAACGTGAVGIDKCRSIEQARCEAAASCGIVDDVDACKRYYRDQCLHGMAHGVPSTTSVDRCVKTIQLAGDCAKKHGADAKLSSCGTPPSAGPNGLTKACDIVTTPQQTDECAFLSAVPPEAGPDAQSDGSSTSDAQSKKDGGSAGSGGDAQADAKAE